MTIREAAAALRKKGLSAVDLATAAIARIERLDGSLRAFITVTAPYALQRARQADAELAAGNDRGTLHGIPIAVKDLFAMRGVRTTAGSKVFENFVPDANATVIDRLEKCGAVLLGKLNLHELAYGITSNNPFFGAVRNPWNVAHIPGGSSGGSGAAVAANMVYAAMGTDTGGSIRIPASFCGSVGLKPTYGRISRHGVMPLAYSLDHAGPLTRSVSDAAVMLNAMAGPDPLDDSSSRHPTVDYLPEDVPSIRGLRVGFPQNFYFERVDADVESAVRGACARAESLGAILKPVTVPDMAAISAIGRVILLAESSAYLEPYLNEPSRFGSDVWSLLQQGRLLPATDYVNAQRLRRRVREQFCELWQEVDCLFTPTTPNTAPHIGAQIVTLGGVEEDVRLATTRFVRGMNVLGLPALSIPCGLSGSGLPIGLQIIGPAFDEALILKVGAALEAGGVGIPPCQVST